MRRTSSAPSATRWRTPSSTTKSLPWPCILVKRSFGRPSMPPFYVAVSCPIAGRHAATCHTRGLPRPDSREARFHPGPERISPMKDHASLAAVIRKNEPQLLDEWTREQAARQTRRDKVHEAEAGKLSKEFLSGLAEAAAQGSSDVRAGSWSKVRDMLTEFSASRAAQGYSPTETALFVLSLKKPLFARLRKDLAG